MSAPGRTIGLDVAALAARDVYRLLAGSVVPRPIAWVTTRGAHGTNVAPFSCYTFISTMPPLLAISCGRRGDQAKDTAANAQREGEFVVNVVGEEFLESMHRSSANLPPEISEVALLGIRTTPSLRVGTPAIDAAPVRMECRTDQVIEFGRLRTQLLIGEVIHFEVRSDCMRADGSIDTAAVRPVARIGGPVYAGLGTLTTLAPVGETFLPPDATERQ